ncbi:hypothetical protein HP548_01020 [Paenibacillus taichungensis]|uniref:Uncharacterized protein n=1 Tax=Paenibacillus taichungensis TaxID=484184 RepID=A0ABX2MI42_9BACL|nr:hypothetical protein [Paenibacillus taichungensis]NUU52682.1 hypothetical protein [Paenibacillus taichungensis]
MKKKMSYLVLLLMIILMVGCTNAENLTITNTEDAQQEVTTVDKEPEETITEVINETEGEETTQTIVDEPVAEETLAQSNNELFSGSKVCCSSNDINVEGQEHIPIEVAILADLLFYRYKFLSRAKDKNLYRLPEWTRT